MLSHVVQLGQGQAHRAGGQCSTQAAHVLRLGHSAQPQAQVARFVAVKHRVAVRQIHRGHTPHTQRLAHRVRFFAGAHQHGDVFGFEALVGLASLHKTGAGITQPGHDLFGAQGRHVGHGVAVAGQLWRMHQRHGGNLS